ncbi:uncharacterized protein LOC108669467 [Hyalella azteca]|uniref:Uncharacterized protein LOC108669467 n=1 Tax=Hyalella azteca TaxID=294128 RepID=A0A8B7NFA0_HYAAZ|nr:uncharacterized protein LOC108669467 [Hyalella azteca]
MKQLIFIFIATFTALGLAVSGEYDETGLFQQPALGVPILKVETSNPYCNFRRMFGPVCNMTGFSGILMIDSGLQLPDALEISVTKADMVVMNPVCVPWIKAYEVQDFTTIWHKSAETAKERNCRTWLRVIDSHVSTLKSGIHDVSLINSSVDTINLANLRDFMAMSSNLSVIEHLDWRGYRGMIALSNISTIFRIESNDNLTIGESHIGKIAQNGFVFNGREMIINQTIFNEVDYNGIWLNSGVIKIENTILQDVKKDGIILGQDVRVIMKNVTIEKCQKPCVQIYNMRYFEHKNFEVNGKPFEEDADVVNFAWEELSAEVKSLDSDEHCRGESEGLSCDFNYTNETVTLTPTDQMTVKQYNISNSMELHIVGASALDVIVYNSHAIYTELTKELLKNESSFDAGGSLTSYNSTFGIVQAGNLRQLTALDSKLTQIHAGTIERVTSQNSALQVRRLNVSEEAEFSNSEISILNANIDGSLLANFTVFGNISTLHILGDAKIFNCIFKQLSIHSITVSGNLSLSNVTFEDYEYLPIYVAEGGSLELVNVWPKKVWHFVSVVDRKQVNWQSDDIEHFITIRQPLQKENVLLVGKNKLHCEQKRFMFSPAFRFDQPLICNYTDVEEEVEVAVDLKPKPFPTSVYIIGAKFLRLASICTYTIDLDNVRNATMDYVAHHCHYQLKISNSSVANIVNEPVTIQTLDSMVGEIEAIFPLDQLVINRSIVHSLTASPMTTEVLNANISSVDMLICYRSLTMNDSSIGSVTSIQVLKFGSIINTKIDRVSYPGIYVDGDLIFENVTIKDLDVKAITFGVGGRLSLKNVIIEKGYIDSIDLSSGSLDLINVTLFGAPLILEKHVQLKINREESKTSEPAKTDSQQPTPILTTPLSVSTPRSTEGPHKVVSEAVKASVTDAQLSPDSPGVPEVQPWIKWATAGASIFLALVVVLIAISLAVVVRNNGSSEPFSLRLRRMFRAAIEDESPISTELDMHVAHEHRDSFTTHYSRLPSI